MNTVQKFVPRLILCVGLLLTALPVSAADAEVAAWVPWFGAEGGTKSAIKNIDSIDVIYPFVYEVASDGTLVNKVNFEDKHWEELFEAAKEHDVKIIPTIAWFDGAEIHSVLSSKAKRKKHVDAITKMVEREGFDGVNIDYEQKQSSTKNHFSSFLKEINTKLKNKSLTCALEARTPPDSLYRDVPKTINYSNDYKAINQYCDWVEIMAYDQQRADLKLNDARRGVPYMPVADKDWVEKVIKMTLKEIDNEKILLGVPTYGRAWDITVAPEWYRDYTRVASLNQPRILELSKKYKSPVGRTLGGEAVISYFPDDSVYVELDENKTPKGTPKGYEAAAKALAAANKTDEEVMVRFITWSDAKAIQDKVKLVEKYNLRGTAIFKVDGEEDQKIWKLF